jgi:hypothetical protein
VIRHQALELVAGVLTAAVRVMQQCVRFAASPDRHDESVGDELRCHRGAHRPADDATREQIDDGSHIQPTFRGPDIREVSDPFAVRSGCFKGAVEHVRSDGARLPLTQIGRQAAPARTCFEGVSNGTLTGAPERRVLASRQRLDVLMDGAWRRCRCGLARRWGAGGVPSGAWPDGGVGAGVLGVGGREDEARCIARNGPRKRLRDLEAGSRYSIMMLLGGATGWPLGSGGRWVRAA